MPDPVPTGTPPHDPVYHCHSAPVPSDPPATVSIFDIPLHELLLDIVITEGSVESVPTETASVDGLLIPHPLPAVTVMLPFCPEVPEITLIDVVPCPELMLHPAGTVQL